MKKIILILCLILVFQNLTADHHTASSLTENLFNAGGRLAIIADWEDWDLLADLNLEYKGEDLIGKSITAGTYYRIHKNIKAGVFYTLQAGFQHDSDWIVKAGEWSWIDTNYRFEHLLSADITPRFLLPFLPGENWVVNMKNRYTVNLSNGQQSYLLLPGLSWFWMEKREPLLNLNGGYGLYFPLNFSDSLLYKQGPWLSALYHLSPQVKLELTGKFFITNWTEATTESYHLGLGVIWTPELP